jgi:trans-aconitate methyltransferase
MENVGRQAHWENVYGTKGETEVSWFQESPTISLDLIRATGVELGASIIDVGGGASRLVDALLDHGFEAVTILDVSEKALATSKARLGTRAPKVRWVVADVTKWEPSLTFDVWHDRAAFHFLTETERPCRICREGFESGATRRVRHHRHVCARRPGAV